MANLLDHRTKVIRQNDMRYGGDEGIRTLETIPFK